MRPAPTRSRVVRDGRAVWWCEGSGHWWRKTLTEAGQEGIRLHDLRHFYASGLIAAGCDVVTVQRALDHAKPSTTLETYSHLWPSAEDKTRTAATALAQEVLRPSGGRTGGKQGQLAL